jgi:predicted metal-dependent phosphoesterase TrpH
VRIDLHTHSNRSDGTDPVAVLLAHAQQSGLDVIALTDHDTADGWTEGRIAAEELGIGFVPGIEISCKLNGISVHLLGYLLDPSYPPLAEELRIVRDGRTDRIPSIVARLNSVGVPLTVDEVLAQATGTPSVGRPHVADALVANGTVATAARPSTDSSPTVAPGMCRTMRSSRAGRSTWSARPAACRSSPTRGDARATR